MLLSNGCEYGLRAAVYLATTTGTSEYVSVRQIGSALDISPSFLTKVLQQLTQADLMTSLRGPRGGVKLAQPADDILLRDVVTAIDGAGLFHECVLGLPECGRVKPCPLHDRWVTERERLETLFSSMSLGTLAERMATSDLRLKDENARGG